MANRLWIFKNVPIK